MKKTTLLLGFVWLMFSCQTEEYEPIATPLDNSFEYEFFSVNLADIELYSYDENELKSQRENEDVEIVMTSKFKTNIAIPEDILASRDVDRFEKYITNNIELIEADLSFYIDGELDKVFEVSKEALDETKTEAILFSLGMNSYPNRNDCSYTGVQQCAQYAIYEGMSTIQKLRCAFHGITCVADIALDCTARNCLGDTAPNDPIE